MKALILGLFFILPSVVHADGLSCLGNIFNRTGRGGPSGSLTSLIENNERAYFERAVGEYKGQTFSQDFKDQLWSRFKRFWMPTYKRAKLISEYHSALTSELQMADLVDGIIRDESSSAVHALTPSHQSKLSEIMARSATERREIKDEVTRVWGDQLGMSLPISADEVKLYKTYREVKKKPIPELQTAAEDLSSGRLDEMNEVLNQARKEAGLPERTVKDQSDRELQLQCQVRDNRVVPLSEEYSVKLNQDSDVSYRVTDRERREDVTYTTESDGNGGTKQVRHVREYYVNVDYTVTPSYRDIIQKDFRRGTSSTSSRLDDIIRETAALRDREYKLKGAKNIAETHYAEIFDSEKNKFVKEEGVEALKERASVLKKREDELHEYMNWSDAQIKKQWADDNISDFKSRNEALYDATRNLRLHLETLAEQVSRKQAELNPVYKKVDYTEELNYLRKKRNQAAWTKAVSLTAIGGGVAYETGALDQFSKWVESKINSNGMRQESTDYGLTP